MRVRATIAVAALAALLPAARADALSCGAPNGPYSDAADVVFDGVMLSGPREEPLGRLVSPARIHVVRYLKGRGPSVVRIGTGVPLLTPGDDGGTQSYIPGLFEPYAGEIYRVFGDTPKGAGRSTARGVLTPHACGGTFLRRTGTYLRGVKGSRAAARDASGRRFAAELLRGPGPLRCLRVHPGLGQDAIECARLRRRDQLVSATVPAGGDSWTTAVAVAGPDLESIDVSGREAAATRVGRVALVLLPGYHERTDLSVDARLRGSRDVPAPGFGGDTLLVADPNREELHWGLTRAAGRVGTNDVACVTYAQRPDTGRPGSAYSVSRHGECGPGNEGFMAVRYIDRYNDGDRRHRYGAIVFGIAPPGTWRVALEQAGGEREMPMSPHGLFGLMLPANAKHGDLTVAFHRPNEAPLRLAGQRDWNVVPPPRSALDR